MAKNLKKNIPALRKTSQKTVGYMNEVHDADFFKLPTVKQMEEQLKKLKVDNIVVTDEVMFYISGDSKIKSKEEIKPQERETISISGYQLVAKGNFPEIPEGGTLFIQYWVEHKDQDTWIVRFKHHPEKRYKIAK